MAVSIPGLSLSILRQQTSVQTGLPLLVSGRFTAFGIGIPAYIRVFLEGPSYDPQSRSFDTFASPFSGDYSVNVIAEKDGQYEVYAQAFPPPLIPTGPPLPEAVLLMPPIAESTRPPLVVGMPFDGGVSAMLPDGTLERLTAPPQTPVEVTTFVTVGAPAVTVGIPGVPTGIPAVPPLPPAGPPPAPAPPAPVEMVAAVVDDIRFSPDQITTGADATGTMTWRNVGDATHSFDIVYYLVSITGARYGPLQVNRNVRVNPNVPSIQGLRMSTGGLPVDIYNVVAEIYDSDTGNLVAAQSLPSRLRLLEYVPPEVPEPIPPPPPPEPITPPPPPTPPPEEVLTANMLGTPFMNLPTQINIGDIWSGTVSLPTSVPVPLYTEARIILRDQYGVEYQVAQTSRTLQPFESLTIPVILDTTGYSEGTYTILMRVYDQFGTMIAEFPLGFLLMLLPELPPTSLTADMLGTPMVNLPSQVNIGDYWTGSVVLPTTIPVPLFGESVLYLSDQYGVETQVARSGARTLNPFESMTSPVNLDTSGFSEGNYSILLRVFDQFGTVIAEFPLGILQMISVLPPPPVVPELPTAEMFGTPFLYAWKSITYGDIWSGNISIPTQWPTGLPTPPSLPSFTVNLVLSLQDSAGRRYSALTRAPTFTPGERISLPFTFATGPQLPGPDDYDISFRGRDIRGNLLFDIPLGILSVLPEEVTPPPPPTYTREFSVGDYITLSPGGRPPGSAQGVPAVIPSDVTMQVTNYSSGTAPDWGLYSLTVLTGTLEGYTFSAPVAFMDRNYRQTTAPPPPPEEPTRIGFAISLLSGNFPSATQWYADFNQRYYNLFIPVTSLWIGEYDMGPGGESGILTVELYDENLKLVKRCTTGATLRNGYAYEFYPDRCQIFEVGQFT